MSLHVNELDPFSPKERQIIFETGQQQVRAEILERRASNTNQRRPLGTYQDRTLPECPACHDADSSLIPSRDGGLVCDICGAKFPHYSRRM